MRVCVRTWVRKPMLGSSARGRAALYAMPNDATPNDLAVQVTTVNIDEINAFAGMRLEIEEMLKMANVIVPNDDGDDEDDNGFEMGIQVMMASNNRPLIFRLGPTIRTKLTIDEVVKRSKGYFDWTPFCFFPARR